MIEVSEIVIPEAAGLAELIAGQIVVPPGTAPGGADADMEFAMMVARGLNDLPRRLESRYLYDSHGSFIFEHICEQPEYYLTRTEASILTMAADEVAVETGPVTIIEFGSGSSLKTQLLLEAYCHSFGSVTYSPIDVSKAILEHAEQQISCRFPAVKVKSLHGTYEEAYQLLGSLSPSLLLFLGSNVGNLDAHESAMFWEKVAVNLNPGDHCLLGVDINEDPESLERAYNDAAGYSEAFTRNMFARMNRELGTAFDIEAIRHVATYNEEWRRVEIFAKFLDDYEIRLKQLDSSFYVPAGDMILTEVSRKFRLKKLIPYLSTFGLGTTKVFSDSSRRFAVLMLKRI